MKNVQKLLKELSIEEKIALVSGHDFWETNAIPRLNIPSMYMTDGPCGLRKQGENRDHLGLNESEKTTSFPTGATFGSSWNPDNMRKMGEAVAKESLFFGVNMILGPAINIKKNPRCGRNFEYLSEDPLLSGEMGKAFVLGAQENGIGTSVKHFAVNNNEDYRFMGDMLVDERALREIYLRGFEKVVKESQPATVMSAYNKVNGVFCGEHPYLLDTILRKEWGFQGAVVSDWGGVNDRTASIKAGMDLEMPGDCDYFREQLWQDLQSGQLTEAELDRCVARVLRLIDETQIGARPASIDFDAHHQLSEDIAVDGAVLMKNQHMLPLDKEEHYLVVGDLFRKMRYQGAGSSLINPTNCVSPEQAFKNHNVHFTYLQGYDEADSAPRLALETEVLKKVGDFDKVLFFGGQTDYVESEGYDRPTIQLPENQRSLIQKLTEAGKKIVFVMYGGSVVELPFIDDVAALLNMYLPGQAGGEATRKLLFGEANPSGKLAETWVRRYQEVPFGDTYVTSKQELYQESIYVGYRYYDALSEEKVSFPFGFGLSYTTFAYQHAVVSRNGDQLTVTCEVTNTGKVAGAEIVQLYVSAPTTDVFKPVKELRGYQKVWLAPQETKQITIRLQVADLAYYNVKAQDWVVENGQYQFHLAAAVNDLRETVSFAIQDQADIPSPYQATELPSYFETKQLANVTQTEFEQLLGHQFVPEQTTEYTMDSKLEELRGSLIGKVFYHFVVGVGEKQYKESLKMPDGPSKDSKRKNGMFLMKMMPNNSLRSMSVSSSGRFKYKIAEGLVDILNHRYFRGVKKMMKKTQAPQLPKESV